MGKQSRTNPACSSSCIVRIRMRMALVVALFGLASRAGWSQTQATSVALQIPAAIAYDAQGNLYIAERAAHVVRRVAPDGTITTVAGTGTQGYSGDGGPATAAELDSPSGLAVDSAGNLFIADTHNQRIRKLDPTGLLTTIAGTGARGFAGDGQAATAAQLNSPTALASAANGDLYLADTGNHRVRRVSVTGGVITTVAGNGVQGFAGDSGLAVSAAIDSPSGLAVDASGNLYLADTHNHRIRRVDATTGVITTVAGMGASAPALGVASGDKGPATSATFALPRGLTIGPDGSVYVADFADHRIRRISPDGTISTVAGAGDQNFAGDGAPAVAAELDSPRAVTVSPAGLVTLADSGNQRIRQLDAASAPGPDIHTIAGLGASVSSGSLTLTGPAVLSYGSGSVTATLAVPGSATGQITFLDTATSSPVTLGAAPLNGGSATFSTAGLPAGSHVITASYAGDITHGAVQSQGLRMTVDPLAISAAAQPVSILYGQTVPALTGVLTGVLPQDSGKVNVSFQTSAAILSPVGAYPITGTLSGAEAANYVLGTTSGAVTIAQAPTSVTASVSSGSAAPGDSVTIAIHAVSSTSGTPTGGVTLLDGTAALAILPLASGGATYTVTSLAAGTHSFSAVYAGDPTFLGSTSAVATVAVGPNPDFNMAATGTAAQSIPSGSSATFTFSVLPQGGALSSPISLAVDGLPPGATASMNPAYLPPGGQVTAFTLTVQTTKSAVAQVLPHGKATLLRTALAGFLLFGLRRRTRLLIRLKARFPLLPAIFASTTCILFATLASGCGNRVNAGADFQNAPTYTLTVTGTATSASGSVLKHSVTVTLQVL